jgi:hypothetical protein
VNLYYKLDENHNPVPTTLDEFAKLFGNPYERIVGQTRVGLVRVSTVFLGIDHNFGLVGGPILFETMFFPISSSGDLYCERYHTWQYAEEGHIRAVKEASRLKWQWQGLLAEVKTWWECREFAFAALKGKLRRKFHRLKGYYF